MKGRLIVIEGLEGAGKSTAIKRIQPLLTALVGEVITTHEPGGTPVANALRTLIKASVEGELLDARAELLLLCAARVQLIERVIRPALERGAWVLSDRSELSTLAYQGGGRKLPLDVLRTLSHFCVQGLTPDLILFLDIEPARGLQRVEQRGARDRIEQEPLAFFEDVARAYRSELAHREHVITIDANQPLQVVEAEVEQAIKSYFLQHVVAHES